MNVIQVSVTANLFAFSFSRCKKHPKIDVLDPKEKVNRLLNFSFTFSIYITYHHVNYITCVFIKFDRK